MPTLKRAGQNPQAVQPAVLPSPVKRVRFSGALAIPLDPSVSPVTSPLGSPRTQLMQAKEPQTLSAALHLLATARARTRELETDLGDLKDTLIAIATEKRDAGHRLDNVMLANHNLRADLDLANRDNQLLRLQEARLEMELDRMDDSIRSLYRLVGSRGNRV